jgi:hypothetical protein
MNESRAYALFREAVLDLNDHSTPGNVRRYLAASRLLDEHRSTNVERGPAETRRRRRAPRPSRTVVVAAES